MKRYMRYLWESAETDYRRALLGLMDRDPNARLLDIGCDDGDWTMQVAGAVGTKSVHGVDLVKERYAKALEKGVDVREPSPDGRLPFEAASFDIVHSNQVIEHVSNIDLFVKEVHRVLAPGGYAVICTENLASWHNIAPLFLGHQPFSVTNISTLGSLGNPFSIHRQDSRDEGMQRYSTWFHVHVLALRAFKELLSGHGLTLEVVGGTGYHPLPPFLARPMARIDPRHSHFIYAKARKAR